MDLAKKIFPFSYRSTDVAGFVVALIIYVIVLGVCGAILGLLSHLFLIGIIFSLLGSIVGLYSLVGLVISILVFLKVVE